MEADVDRKPVAVLCAPAVACGADHATKKMTATVNQPFDDPLFAAARRMRLQDAADDALRNETLDAELERMRSYE